MTQNGFTTYVESVRHGKTEHLFEGRDGRIAARFFNARLSSVFQAIRSGTNLELQAYEAMVRSFSVNDTGLSVLTLLEHATTDNESVELDRLCRLLHVLNFFRQHPAPHLDLYLSVHSRLLAAVSGNHGAAFQRVLASLDIPQERIVLQLPAIVPSQAWAVAHVAQNYRRNGFRFAVHARGLAQATELLASVHPDVLKLNAEDFLGVPHDDLLHAIVAQAERQQCRVILRNTSHLNLTRLLSLSQSPALSIQGDAIDIARSSLPVCRPRSSTAVPASVTFSSIIKQGGGWYSC